MKVVALLFAFGIIGFLFADLPPLCENFISKIPSTTCGHFQTWTKFSFTETYSYFVTDSGKSTATKIVRAIKITDPTIKMKTLRAESIIAKLKHPNIPKLEEAIEFEGWRIQKYDKMMNNLFLVLTNSILISSNDLFVEYVNNLKEITVIIEYVNSQGYVLTNVSLKSFLLDVNSPKRVYFYEFEETVEKGTAIDDRGDFHYWEPSRLNGEEKVWTEQADHYAFGVMLYKAFNQNGALFSGETKEEYTKNVNIGDYEVGKYCLPEIAFIIARMLHKDPKNRISLKNFETIFDYIKTGKFKKTIATPIKLNNQKPLPQELLDQINPEFIVFVKSLNISIDPSNEQGLQTNFWLTSKGLILISGLTFILLLLIVWSIVSCLRKNPDGQMEGQKLTTGLDNTKDVEVAV